MRTTIAEAKAAIRKDHKDKKRVGKKQRNKHE